MKIAFASGKGGTGKTALSVNFSLYASTKDRVVLVDLDVEEPDVLIFFQNREKNENKIINVKIPAIVKEKCDLCGKCVDVCNFNALLRSTDSIKIFPQLCKNCMACSDVCPNNAVEFEDMRIGEIFDRGEKNDLRIIEGRLDIGDIHTKTLIKRTKEYIQNNYDITVYDCPPGTTCPMVEAVMDSNLVVLVAEPTLFGLNDLDIAVTALIKLKKRYAVVINKTENNNDLIHNYCRDKNINILTEIPFDEKIFQRCSSGFDCLDIDWFSDRMDMLYQSIQKELK